MIKTKTRRQVNEAKNRHDRRRRNAQSGKQPARDPKYLAFIRLWSCVVCFVNQWREYWPNQYDRPYLKLQEHELSSEACHMGPHGIGQKASDYTAIPMCAACHQKIGSSVKKIESLGIKLVELQLKLRQAYEQQR